MMKSKVAKALNKQINEELYSAYLYSAMVAYFEDLSLKGFAHYMRMQALEEMAHAQKIIDFLYERGARVKFTAIAEPQLEWDSPLAVMEGAYKHECHITECINKLSTLAIAEDDHATRVFLEWFVTEQVEEEANADDWVSQLKMLDGNPQGLFMLDKEAGARTMPTVLSTLNM